MVAEIISTVERRRSWPPEVKLRVLSEALSPGASVTAVANRNGVCRSQVYTWLRLARQDRLPGLKLSAPSASAPGFVPVHVASAPSQIKELPALSSPAPERPLSRRRSSMIEVVLANGRTVKADEGIDPATLARLVAALDVGARLRQDEGGA